MSLLSSIFSVLRFNKKNWKAVVLCFFAAMVFWFFNALNKNYTSNISFPLEFDFDRQYYLAVDPLPNEVRINVTGNGWDLFRRSAGIKVPPLVIPLERPSEVKKIVGTTLPALFSSQLETMQINFVVTDTIYIDVEPKVKRWLSLTIDSAVQYIQEGYGIAGDIQIMPDSIFIEGPLSVVTILPEPYNLRLNAANIGEDYSQEIEVRFENGHAINRNPPVVTVAFPVEPFIEVTEKIRLEVINIPEGANPEIGPTKISATLRILQNETDIIKSDSVKAVIDLKDFKRGVIKMAPEIIGIPAHAEVIKIDTIKITY